MSAVASVYVGDLRGWGCIELCALLCLFIQSCLTLCDPMYCNRPGFPVHYLLELAQTHVHQVNDAIQSSHPLSHTLLLLPSIFPSVRVKILF